MQSLEVKNGSWKRATLQNFVMESVTAKTIVAILAETIRRQLVSC